MASSLISTLTIPDPGMHCHFMALAGSRIWVLYNSGSNLELRYYDTNWSAPIVLSATFNRLPVGLEIYNDGGTYRLRALYAGGNNAYISLYIRSINGGVNTGTPTSPTAESVIQSGGANPDQGTSWGYAFSSPSGTNPRLWVIGKKWTAIGVTETRAWYVSLTGTTADTGSNWVSTNFTNLGANSPSGMHGVGTYWTIGGSPRVTLLFGADTTPAMCEAVTFDPSVATPSPPAPTSNLFSSASMDWDDWNITGPQLSIASPDNNYIVACVRDRINGTIELWKSVDGITWTQPNANWQGIVAGRHALTKSSTNLYLLHTVSWGDHETSVQGLRLRRIVSATNSVEAAATFSDTDGNIVTLPSDTGATTLYAAYRAGNSSGTWALRSDSIAISAGDTTAPGPATNFTATPLSSGTVNAIEATIPNDSDVSQFEIRMLTGATYPNTTRTDGVVIAGPTNCSPGETIFVNHTSLTAGTRYRYRLLIKDTTGNWQTVNSVTATAVASTPFVFLQRYKEDLTPVSDGLTQAGNNPVLEFQMAASCWETGQGNAHVRLRRGDDNSTPPEVNISEEFSKTAPLGRFRYEDPAGSGTYQNWPASGLLSVFWARKFRYYSQFTTASYFSARAEQNT